MREEKKKYNWKYKIIYPGYNYRLSDIACSLGLTQLSQLSKFIKKRLNIFNLYKNTLKNFSNFLYLPESFKDQLSANHLFIIIFKKNKLKISRDEIIQKLFKKRVLTQVHYIPVYKHPYYKKICKEFFKFCFFIYKGIFLYNSFLFKIPFSKTIDTIGANSRIIPRFVFFLTFSFIS